MFWGFHGLWLLLPLVLLFKFFWIGLLVLLIAGMVRAFGRRNRWAAYYRGQMPFYTPGTPHSQPSALEILRQRYARGEIDATTYEQMRERLEASGRPEQQ